MTTSRPELTALLGQLHVTVDGPQDAEATSTRVASSLRACTPTLDVLTASERQGDPDRVTSRILHAEKLFSVVALVWRSGQQTTVHDHLAWCVVTVLCGTEQETVYRTTATISPSLRARSIRPVRSQRSLRPVTSTASATRPTARRSRCTSTGRTWASPDPASAVRTTCRSWMARRTVLSRPWRHRPPRPSITRPVSGRSR